MAVDVSIAPLSAVHLLGPFSQPILYALGLVSIFLLAFRGRWADRAISLILSVLWACMALGFWFEIFIPQRELTWLGGLLLVQAVLFFWEGVVRGRLDLEPRAATAPVLGGLFVLYALVIQPAMGAAFDIERFREPVLGLPFPAVLFTIGILLFLQRGFPRSILILPLVWAAIGGVAAFQPDAPRDFGMLAALLAGSFLALPRRAIITDTTGNSRDETTYELAARHHRNCGRAVLALLLFTSLLGFAVAYAEGPSMPLVRQLERSTTLLSALMLGLWLSLPAWYSAGFRILAWEATRGLRAGWKLWDWLTARWGGAIVLLALLLGAIWQIYAAVLRTGALDQAPLKDLGPEDLALVGLVLVLLYAIYRARRRIIISEFHNHTGDDSLDSLSKGLAARLHNELACVTSLYRTIDEAMPPQKGRVIGVTLGVEDVVKSLDDILGPNSSVKLGTIEIPIGLLFRGLSRLVRGPRLTGGLLKEGAGYILLAELSGGGLSGSWRVTYADLGEAERRTPAEPGGEAGERTAATAAVYRMTEQLAYRIITALGNLGSPRWEAVRHFTSGLRAYRGTQMVKGDSSPELRAAERHLIEALSVDRNFSQCHYNLGVIYQSLGVQEAAEAAYRQVLAENPDWFEAYYALATLFFEEGSYKKAAIFARKMIEVQPGDARAWNLHGIARFLHRDQEARDQGELGQSYRGPAWKEIVRSFKIAAAVAWRSLCRASFRVSSRSLSREMQLAVRCTNNLAIVKGDEGDGDAQRTVLEQSFRLSPRDARAHLIRGGSLFDEKDWHAARTELYKVFADALEIGDHVERWVHLLGAHAALANPPGSPEDKDIVRATRSLLNHMVPPESLVLGSTIEADAARTSYGDQLNGFEISLRQAREKLARNDPPIDPFASPLAAVHFLRGLEIENLSEADLAALRPAGLESWAEAQELIRRGRQRLGSPEASDDVRRAIEILEKDFERQIELQGLHSLRARAHRLAGRDLVSAVGCAEQSVAQEPGSAERRWILADIYSALGDFEEACTERETALRLGPSYEVLTDLAALRRIARDYLLFSGPQDRPAPDARVRRGMRFFERALQIVESRRPTRSPVQCAAHAAAHYWLGRFHCELGETDPGLDHLRVARSIGFYPIELGLQMGHVYSFKRDYDDAERAFFESLRAARRGALTNGSQVLADNGPLEALEVEALLSWAMLRAERGERLRQASRLCDYARKRLGSIQGERRRHLRALYHECRGWLRFQEQEIEESRKELERAARCGDSRSIQARLAKVYEAAGESGLLDSKEALRKAATARGKYGPVHGNGYRRGVFDLLLLSQAAGEQPQVASPPALPS